MNFNNDILNQYSINIYTINKKVYLFSNTKKKYFLIPSYIYFKKCKNTFYFTTTLLIHHLESFLLSLRTWIKLLDKYYVGKVLLKGLGLRVSFSKNFINLELKLGFSHLVTILIPNGIKIFLLKGAIIAKSKNKLLVGNFLYRLRKLKVPNSYKGKGIWYKNEVKLLKIIKKS